MPVRTGRIYGIPQEGFGPEQMALFPPGFPGFYNLKLHHTILVAGVILGGSVEVLERPEEKNVFYLCVFFPHRDISPEKKQSTFTPLI